MLHRRSKRARKTHITYEQLQTELAELKKVDAVFRDVNMKAMAREKEQLTAALEDMCYQFAGWHDSKGGYMTNGLSALEGAFATLGWKEPHICKAVQCDEPGCKKQRTCGWRSKKGYRRTCSGHHRTKGK